MLGFQRADWLGELGGGKCSDMPAILIFSHSNVL